MKIGENRQRSRLIREENENRRKSAAISISILEFREINSRGEWNDENWRKSVKIDGDHDFDFGISINSREEWNDENRRRSLFRFWNLN